MPVLAVAEGQALDLQQRGRGRLGRGQRLGAEPGAQFLGIGVIQHDGVNVGGVLGGRDVNARIPHGRDVKRLTDAVFCQQCAGQKLVGAQVGQDAALVDQHNAIHAAPEHVLKAVLNDEDCRVGLLLDCVDQLNGLLARSRVKVCQRLIKQ